MLNNEALHPLGPQGPPERTGHLQTLGGRDGVGPKGSVEPAGQAQGRTSFRKVVPDPWI